MSDRGKPSAAPADDILEQLVLEESSGDDDGSAGLELDAAQAAEIRKIFLATLPDYLEPIRQLIKQLVSGRGDRGAVAKSLDLALTSIDAAASRVGVDDVCSAVEALQDVIALASEAAPNDDESGPRVQRAFGALCALAGMEQQADGHAGTQRQQTILEALGADHAVERRILDKLTAAGLLTVDQLQMAAPGEIAAVTGLGASEVDGLLSALGLESVGADGRRNLTSSPEQRRAAGTRTAHYAPLAEAELRLDESRAAVVHVSERIRAHKERLQTVHEGARELKAALARTRAQIAERLVELADARTKLGAVERELSEIRAEVTRAEAAHSGLAGEREELAEQYHDLSHRVSAMAERVHRAVLLARTKEEYP
jgi:hypothetical protein